jgi:nucleoside-diphosphate-sugar epimerase
VRSALEMYRPGKPDNVIRDDLDEIIGACERELGELSGASLLLTGATGFVGRYLVESLLRFNEIAGRPPCVMTLPTRRPHLLVARYGPQVEAGQVVAVEWGPEHTIDLPGRRWDYVIHGAAAADPKQFMVDPVTSMRDAIGMSASIANVARRSSSRRLVLISSGAVYGQQPPDVREIPESSEGRPDISAPAPGYGESKRISELLFRETGLDQRVARVFSLIGPYQDLMSSFAVPDLIRQASHDAVLRLEADGQARRSFCYASDLTVVLIKLLAGESHHDVYNVGSRKATASIAEVAHVIAEIFGGLGIQLGSEPSVRRDYVAQLDRLYETYVPRVGLHEALLRTCHSMHARGLISRRPAIELGSPGFRR